MHDPPSHSIHTSCDAEYGHQSSVSLVLFPPEASLEHTPQKRYRASSFHGLFRPPAIGGARWSVSDFSASGSLTTITTYLLTEQAGAGKMSSHQIDPRLYRPAPTYPNNTSSNQPRFGPPGTRLPPIDQTHQLPPLSNNAPLQQPYYRLPPATAAPLQRPTPTPLERPLEPNSSRYDDSPTSPTYDQDEPQLQTVDDAKRSRACEACRGLKVRCDRVSRMFTLRLGLVLTCNRMRTAPTSLANDAPKLVVNASSLPRVASGRRRLTAVWPSWRRRLMS